MKCKYEEEINFSDNSVNGIGNLKKSELKNSKYLRYFHPTAIDRNLIWTSNKK